LGHQRDEWQKPDEVIVKKRIVAEVTRYKKFEASLLGQDLNFEVGDIDIKRYIKFLLKDGMIEEKRNIINCFNGKIVLNQKQILLSQ
jgi:hypothetical protein